MAVSAQWLDSQQTIVHQIYEGHWTWVEWHQADAQTWELIRSVEHPVDFIADLRASAEMPAGFLSNASSVAGSAAFASPMVRRIVVVGATQTYKVMGEFFRRVFPGAGERMAFFDTLEDAAAFLAEGDR